MIKITDRSPRHLLAFSPDGQWLASSHFGEIWVRSASGTSSLTYPLGKLQVTALALSMKEVAWATVDRKGLAQVSDAGAIEKFCDDAIAANPKVADDFRAGKAAALNFLKGQVMKLSRGKANPQLVGEILEKKLKG
jgi:aspartyl-tRNA(Asn)/glutamyl-tRNA(Gln) amidotransferase subunit B